MVRAEAFEQNDVIKVIQTVEATIATLTSGTIAGFDISSTQVKETFGASGELGMTSGVTNRKPIFFLTSPAGLVVTTIGNLTTDETLYGLHASTGGFGGTSITDYANRGVDIVTAGLSVIAAGGIDVDGSGTITGTNWTLNADDILIAGADGITVTGSGTISLANLCEVIFDGAGGTDYLQGNSGVIDLRLGGNLKIVFNSTALQCVNVNLDIYDNVITTTISNGDITIEPNGTGDVVLGTTNATGILKAYMGADLVSFPGDNGSNGQFMQVNGSGVITWVAGTAQDLVSDGSPQLGANLDVNGFDIVSVSNGQIEIAPNGTGLVLVTSGATSGNAFRVTADSVTTGRMAYFYSDSAGATNTTDGAVFIHLDNSLADGFALAVTNDGTGGSLFISQNGIADNWAFYLQDNATTSAIIMEIETTTLTTGIALWIYNNSNTFTGTGCVTIELDHASATGVAFFVNHDGNGKAIHVDSEATSATVLDIDATKITSGRGAHFYNNTGMNNTADGFVFIECDHTSTSGTVLAVQQDGNGTAVWIDHNAQGYALDIDSEATAATVMRLQADLITTGRGLWIYNNAAMSNTSDGFVFIEVDSINATGHVLWIQNDGTGNTFRIDQNGNGVSLNIDSEATTATALNIACLGSGNGINIVHAGTGRAIDIFSSVATDKAASISVNSLTSGNSCGLWLSTTSSSFSGTNRGLLYIIVDDPGASGTCVKIVQDGTGQSMLIDHNNGVSIALKIETVASSADVIDISIAGALTAKAIHISSSTATSGDGIYIDMTKSTYSGDVATFICNGASATGKCLMVQHDGVDPGKGIHIDINGNAIAIDIDATTTSNGVLDIDISGILTGKAIAVDANAATSGWLLYLGSTGMTSGKAIEIALEGVFTGKAILITSSTATSGDGIYIDMSKSDYSGVVASFIVNGASATGKCLYIQNDGTGDAIDIDQAGAGAAINIIDGYIQLDATPATDLRVTGGNVLEQTAGSTFNQFDMVRLSADGKWDKSDAATGTATLAYGMAITAGTDTNSFKVLLPPGAIVRKDAWTWSNPGVLLYAPEGGGGQPTETAPSTGGDLVQKIGFALDDDHAYIFTCLEVTTA